MGGVGGGHGQDKTPPLCSDVEVQRESLGQAFGDSVDQAPTRPIGYAYSPGQCVEARSPLPPPRHRLPPTLVVQLSSSPTCFLLRLCPQILRCDSRSGGGMAGGLHSEVKGVRLLNCLHVQAPDMLEIRKGSRFTLTNPLAPPTQGLKLCI